MKKMFLVALIGVLISGCCGCKSNVVEPTKTDNAFPLTNQVQHIDGTEVKAPTW